MKPAFLYQRQGTTFLRSRSRAFLADEPGLGKTRQLLDAAEGRTLVVAPAYASGVWDRESKLWTPDLDLSVAAYSSLSGREKGSNGASRTTGTLRDEWEGPWDTVIFDEAHYIKGRAATWTKLAHRLRAERIYQASGTPIIGWAHETWSNLRLLAPEHVPASYWKWLGKWFATWEPPWGGTQVLGLKGCVRCEDAACGHWVRFFERNFGDDYLGRAVEEVWHDRPPLTQQTIRVNFDASQRREYDTFVADFRVVLANSSEMIAWNHADLVNKLRTLTLEPKLDVFRELLPDRSLPLVVFCHFRETARRIEDIVNARGLRVARIDGGVAIKTRERIVDDFQRGKLDVLVGTLGATSEAITLTRGHEAIFVEHSWLPSRNRQAIRRLHRLGQDHGVHVLHLVTRNSVDSRLGAIVAEKKDQALRFMAAAEFSRTL